MYYTKRIYRFNPFITLNQEIIKFMWQPKDIIASIKSGEIKKVLFVGPSRIGDALFNTPLIKHFKSTYPELSLYYLITTYARKCIIHNPNLDGIIHYDRKAPRPWRWLEAWKMQKEVGRYNFDLAICFSLNSNVLNPLKKAGIPRFFPSVPEQFPELSSHTHSVQNAMKLISLLGVHSEPGPMEIFYSLEDEKYVQNFMKKKGLSSEDSFVVIHPGCYQIRSHRFLTISARRLWPMENFREVAIALHRELGLKIIFSGSGKGEMRMIKKITKNISIPFILGDSLDILHLSALLKKATLMLTVDTGPMHIAAALETPLIALFGPTPVHKTRPWGNGKSTVLRKKMDCSPCRGKGISCYNNICMKNITVQEVVEATKEMLPSLSKKK